MTARSKLALLSLFAAIAPAQEAEAPGPQTLLGTLWMQTSEEWRGIALQSYRLAALMLDRGLRDKKSTAAGQTGAYSKLPPAVILDIDETVLDNSPAQARDVRAGTGFDREAWSRWVAEAAATAIPGAVEFCQYAATRGATVFYVSNRDAPMEAATRANLARLGFPLSAKADTVLLRGEKPEWGSDKTTRVAEVAARYRVVLRLGDDLNDFLDARTTVARRAELMRDHRARWGRDWILLPNPVYGSWEQALYGDQRPPTPAGRLKAKMDLLRVQ